MEGPARGGAARAHLVPETVLSSSVVTQQHGSHAREAGLRMSSIALRGKVSLIDRSNHFLLRGVAWYDQSESPVAEPGAADGGSTQCSALALALPAGVAGAASWA